MRFRDMPDPGGGMYRKTSVLSIAPVAIFIAASLVTGFAPAAMGSSVSHPARSITFLGASESDRIIGLAVDAAGNAYVAGITNSPDFPVTARAFDKTYNGGTPGAWQTVAGDAFVAKLDPAGGLVYATYLGGSFDDSAMGVAVDAAGNAYVTGATFSADFPTTRNAFDRSYNENGDAFVAVLDPSGSKLLYSTYLGGSGPLLDIPENARSIDVDASGKVYVSGFTTSIDFPTTSNAFDRSYNGLWDAFVAIIDPGKKGARSLLYATYHGGSGFEWDHGIAADLFGNAYVTGFTSSTDFPTTDQAFASTFGGGPWDVYVAKLDPTKVGTESLVYSTYVGGSNDDSGSHIDVDDFGNAYVTGETCSSDFPTTPGAFAERASPTTRAGAPCGLAAYDAFVFKLNPEGSELVYSTYLGGSAPQHPTAIVVDGLGSAHIASYQWPDQTPRTDDAFDRSWNGGWGDVWIAKLSLDGSTLLYSTALGGLGQDVPFMIALDGSGNLYVAGHTTSRNFPVTEGAFDQTYNGGFDGFVTKLDI